MKIYLLIAILVSPFFIWSQNDEITVITQEKNLGTISKITYSSDNRFIASANEGNYQIKIWDVTSGKLIGTLNGHQNPITKLKFNDKKGVLVSIDNANHFYIWDLNRWQIKDSLSSEMGINNFEINPNTGNYILSNIQNELTEYTGEKTIPISKFKTNINSFATDNQNIYVATESEITILGINTYKKVHSLEPQKKTNVLSLITVNDGFLAQTEDGMFFYYNDKFLKIKEFKTIKNPNDIAVSKERYYVAMPNNSGEVVIWNYLDGSQVSTLYDMENNENVRSLSFSANGYTLATSSYKRTLFQKVKSNNNVIQIWNVDRKQIIKTLKGEVNPVESFAFSPTQNHLFSLRAEVLDIWSLNSGERLGTIQLQERKIEVKDRAADKLNEQKENTKDNISQTAKNANENTVATGVGAVVSGNMGDLIKRKAEQRIKQKVIETKENAKEELKYTGKAAFKRFGFQDDKIVISPLGNYMLTAFSKDEIRLYSIKNGLPEYIDYVKTGQKEFHDVLFDPEEKYIIIGGVGNEPVSIVEIDKIQETKPKKLKVDQNNNSSLSTNLQSANAMAITKDGKYLVALFNTGRIVAWSTGYWSIIMDFNPKVTLTKHPFIGFSADETKLFVNTGLGVYTYHFALKSDAEITNMQDVLGIEKTKIEGYPVMTHKPMNHLISIADNYVSFLDVINNKVHKTESLSADLITDVQVNKFGYVGISFKNGAMRVFDPNDGKERFMMVGQDDNAIFKTPDNYYKMTKEGHELVTFRVGKNAYPFEQFDATNNRPDLVLKAMNSEDESLITLYNKAFLKRLSKLGITSQESVSLKQLPSSEISNYKDIPISTDQRTVSITISAKSKEGNLKKLLVWNNDVPVFGGNGRAISGNTFNEEITLNLASGHNKIQIAVQDEKGRESLKETIDIECLQKSKPNLYIVSVGTSIYKDKRYNLDYAAKDAKDIVAQFQKENDLYAEVKAKILTDQQSLGKNIQELKSFLKDATIDDVVIVFVAGHGLLDAKYDYFYGTHDVDFNNPGKNGLAYERLESILDGIAPLKKILIMDTCHSGEVEEEELLVSEEDLVEDESVMFRAVGPALTTIDASPTKMMKELFSDLRRGTGTTVLSSAGGAEFAMESNDWKNGLFTYSLLFGLRNNGADLNGDGKVMLSELQIYVTDRVTELSHGKQTPTTRIQNLALDYRIW